MCAEGLTWELFTPFALRRLKSRHHKYKSRQPKIIKNEQQSLKIDKIHKIHAPKIQGRVFSEVAEAPQASCHQPHSAEGGGGGQKSNKINENQLKSMQID